MDIEQMKELIKAVSESKVTCFEFEDGTDEIKIKKANKKTEIITAPVPATSAILPAQANTPIVVGNPASDEEEPETAQTEDAQPQGNVVKSPLVGTFYSSASPEAEPFVKVGDHVKKGQVLGIIEAMKLMNDIESEYDGEVVKILVNNKDMVEYEQPLFIIA